ncbi:MAG: ParB/RepB/Spo0J family partition protein [Myxococcota bacterium]|nr:ParB/RepB/Spo0J family partition protein [Myxococcota bacterium]
MSGIQKTEGLERRDIDIDLLIPNEDNPNEMSDEEFNNLMTNMEEVGFTDPMLVRPHPDHEGKFKIIGGHHRWECAKLAGYAQVPCTIIVDPEFGDEEEAKQLMRHNLIRGKISPAKFRKMWENMKFEVQDPTEFFGFTDEDEFLKLIQAVRNTQVPDDKKEDFDKAIKEIKTVDELADVLNRILFEGGSDLDYGFMVFDFEGNDSVWLRMLAGMLPDFKDFASVCKEHQVAVDHGMKALFMIAAEQKERLAELVADAPKVQLDTTELVTLDFLDGYEGNIEEPEDAESEGTAEGGEEESTSGSENGSEETPTV